MAQNLPPSGGSAIARLLWMFIFPMILLVLTITIVRKGGLFHTGKVQPHSIGMVEKKLEK